MSRKVFRTRLSVVAGAGVAVSLWAPAGALAGTTPGYRVADVGPYGGEPSIVSDSAGTLYDTTPSGGTLIYRSTDGGKTWQPGTTADPSSGDDCLATDQAGAV